MAIMKLNSLKKNKIQYKMPKMFLSKLFPLLKRKNPSSLIYTLPTDPSGAELLPCCQIGIDDLILGMKKN